MDINLGTRVTHSCIAYANLKIDFSLCLVYYITHEHTHTHSTSCRGNEKAERAEQISMLKAAESQWSVYEAF